MKNKFSITAFILPLVFLISCNNEKQETKKEQQVQQDTANTMKRKTILFFGNSLTAGYGLESPDEAFPGIIQQRLDSLGLPYAIVNAGVSGETSAGGKGRIDWILKQPVDIFVLELGANDGLRGIPLDATRKNLQFIIDRVRSTYPNSKLVMAGMEIPPNMGKDYITEFRNIYTDLAKENNMVLIPFLLEGVGGEPELNQPDGIHPTEEGHRILAENVWKKLEPLVKAQ